ncbi:MAG: helix-hairpin-helix domain-containing protein [Candidatus Saccharicenans sp.]|nr:helix-hairpin-helix domain-containing protein [Candidatus Saccharicenans sp.]
MTGAIRKVTSFSLVVLMLALAAGLVLAQNQSASTTKKININTAPVSELQTLPRIGPKVAQRIVDYRTQNGPFKKIEDIMKVRGIGEKVFNQIKDLITVGEAK